MRGLAKDLRLSPVTVSAAYGALNRRGLLLTEGRLGTRVNPRPPVSLPRPEVVVGAGLRDLATGNPDPDLLPRLGPALRGLEERPRLYGSPAAHPGAPGPRPQGPGP